MKRNKISAHGSRSGTSPYARYQKRPYRYSPAYYQWRRAMAPKASETVQEREAAREAQ